MSKNLVEQLQDLYMNHIVELKGLIKSMVPENTIIMSALIRSYQQLTPEQQARIVEELGADWYLSLAAKIEKDMRRLTK